MSLSFSVATMRPSVLTSATSCPTFNRPANSASTGNAIGMVQAYSLPLCSMTDSSSTRLYVAESIGPTSGLSPPSPSR